MLRFTLIPLRDTVPDGVTYSSDPCPCAASQLNKSLQLDSTLKNRIEMCYLLNVKYDTSNFFHASSWARCEKECETMCVKYV